MNGLFKRINKNINIIGIERKQGTIRRMKMSDYRMDIKGDIGLSEYSNIYDYLGIVDKNDKFMITLDKNDNNEINIINSMLKDNNFFVSEEGYNDLGNYYINAQKIK